MEQNNLLLLALKQIFELSAIPCNKYRFVSAELGFVRSMRGVLEISEQIFAFGQPYRLTEGRVYACRVYSCASESYRIDT